METNQQNQQKKINGCLKWFLIFIGIMILFGIIGKISGTNHNEKQIENKNNLQIEKLQNKKYSDLKYDEKKVLFDAFLEGENQFEAQNFLLNENINKTIASSAKFPDTFEIKGLDGEFHKDYESYTSISKNNVQNINYDNGNFEIVREIRSENSLGMKVRNNIFIKLKFDGKTANIIDVKTE